VLALLHLLCFVAKPHANAAGQIQYYKDGRLVTEPNPSYRLLRFLYGCPVGKLVRRLLRSGMVSSLAGTYKNSWLSKWYIDSFIKTYQIDMSEYEVPAGGYQNFNEFFIRKLK